jgi:hypothetical protein
MSFPTFLHLLGCGEKERKHMVWKLGWKPPQLKLAGDSAESRRLLSRFLCLGEVWFRFNGREEPRKVWTQAALRTCIFGFRILDISAEGVKLAEMPLQPCSQKGIAWSHKPRRSDP